MQRVNCSKDVIMMWIHFLQCSHDLCIHSLYYLNLMVVLRVSTLRGFKYTCLCGKNINFIYDLYVIVHLIYSELRFMFQNKIIFYHPLMQLMSRIFYCLITDPLLHGFWRFGSDGNLYMFGKKTVKHTFNEHS
jgi:hypothetical protein